MARRQLAEDDAVREACADAGVEVNVEIYRQFRAMLDAGEIALPTPRMPFAVEPASDYADAFAFALRHTRGAIVSSTSEVTPMKKVKDSPYIYEGKGMELPPIGSREREIVERLAVIEQEIDALQSPDGSSDVAELDALHAEKSDLEYELSEIGRRAIADKAQEDDYDA
jgi:hypothetical protein